MARLFQMILCEARDECGPFYDGTNNGEQIFSRVRNSEAFARIAALIRDEDRYQEVADGKIECDLTGE